MRPRASSPAAALMLLTVASCAPQVQPPAEVAHLALEYFDSCAQQSEWLAEALAPQVTAWGLGGGLYGFDRPVVSPGVPDRALAMPSAAPDLQEVTTGTNTQRQDVDEADLVKTDGRHLYAVGPESVISFDVPSRTVIDSLDLPSAATDHRLLLHGDVLMVAGSQWSDGREEASLTVIDLQEGRFTAQESYALEGRLVDLRQVGGLVHLVLRHDLASRLPLRQPAQQTEAAQEAALRHNRQVVASLDAGLLLPRVRSGGQVTDLLGCDRIARTELFSGTALTYLASFDLSAASGPRPGGAVLAETEAVYSSPTSLYVATPPSLSPAPDATVPLRPEETTVLHRFDLTSPDGGYVASAEVPGRLLNSYSLGEWDGHLRVATTVSDGTFESPGGSAVHVLEVEGMQQVGSVSGIAPGERIFSVRYLEDVAYMVTFEQVDPLFVIDLSDPAQPELQGELKIPGFSTWLQPTGDGFLLALGRDGDWSGRLGGVQFSLFDARDPRQPLLVDTLAVGDDSEASWDVHAILWDATSGLLGAPAQSWGSSMTPRFPGGIPPSEETWQGPAASYLVARRAGGELLELARVPVSGWARRMAVVSGIPLLLVHEGSALSLVELDPESFAVVATFEGR